MRWSQFRRGLGCAFLCCATLGGSLAAQETRERDPLPGYIEWKQEMLGKRRAFVERRGRAAEARENKGLVQAANAHANAPDAIRALLQEGSALNLAMLGFNPGRIRALQARGIDVIGAVAAGPEASLAQRASLADLVVIGEIVEFDEDTPEIKDGLHSSLVVRPVEVLKGDPPTEPIIVRQESGKLPNGLYREVTSELIPPTAAPGRRFLMLLSNQLYEYQVEQRVGATPSADQPKRYVFLGSPLLIDSQGDLIPISGAERPERDLPAVSARIRDVAQRMQAVPNQ